MESVKDLQTKTKRPYKTPTSLEEVDTYAILDELTREDTAKLW